MNLKDRYNIPQPTWQAMIKDGVISCSVARHDEIIEKVLSKKAGGMSNAEAIKTTSIETNICDRVIYRIMKRYF